jgi:enoyl-CoA hydratase/carnithine racemase
LISSATAFLLLRTKRNVAVSTRLVVNPQDDILLLRLESDDGLPRLEMAVLDALDREVVRLAEASELAGAVITGSELAFAAGAEIAEVARLTPRVALAFARRGQEVLGRIASSAKPVVAAIRGYCIGGGLDLALACHARIAAADAVFAHPGVRRGIITGWGGTQRLPRLIGRGPALEMLITGSRIRSREASPWGLVSKVSADDELRDDATHLARALARQHGRDAGGLDC